MRIGLVLVLIPFLFVMFAAQTLYDANQEENKTFDIYNFTENNLNWNSSKFEPIIKDNVSEHLNMNFSQIQSRRISNLINKGVDWLGYSLFEISKWSLEFGYTHPQYDFEFFAYLLYYYIMAILIVALIPVIIPLIALVWVLISGMIWIYKFYAKPKTKQARRKNDMP